jgi:cytochrome c553
MGGNPKTIKSPLLLLALLSPLIWAGLAEAIPLTDNNNKHNLSSSATHGGVKAALPGNGGTDEICVFCHTPHGASAQSTLWNRVDPGNMGSFPLYGNPLVIKGDFPGQPDPAGAVARSQYQTVTDYPNGASKMCLSCHDGNTALIGEVLNAPNDLGGSIAMVNLGSFSKTVALNTSHPISFVYNNSVLADIVAVPAKAGAYRLPAGPAATDVRLDGNSRMQCTTCHDPHSDTRSDVLIALPFWRHNPGSAATAYSNVCNACHTPIPADLGGPPIHGL